jgi:hypothetical protein
MEVEAQKENEYDYGEAGEEQVEGVEEGEEEGGSEEEDDGLQVILDTDAVQKGGTGPRYIQYKQLKLKPSQKTHFLSSSCQSATKKCTSCNSTTIRVISWRKSHSRDRYR